MLDRGAHWVRQVVPAVFVALFASCDSTDPPDMEVTNHSLGAVDTPIAPDGLLDRVAPSRRDAEFARLTEGTPIEELPADERAEVEAANARDALRGPARSALRSLAEAQARRAIEDADAGPPVARDAGAIEEVPR